MEESYPNQIYSLIEIVVELVEEDNDATLQQLSARLEEKTGIKVKVSVSTMCRLLQRLS
jgi:transposase